MTPILWLPALTLLALSAQDPAVCDGHANAQHDRAASVDERGDRVMGFEQTKTAHHFHLSETGGSIEVAANDPNDSASRDQVRAHLSHIAEMFARGDFDAPMLIHGEEPPGVAVLKRRKAAIRYVFAPTERGGRITISTKNAEARRAVHEFLRYQIREHRTGDSPAVGSSRGPSS